MKLLDRYIGKEILVTAVFAVSVLSFVLVLGNIFKKLLDLMVNRDVPLEIILSIIAYILPFSLTFTIPWGFLTAVLLVFGKLSAENELIALRSSGISIPRICLPLLFISFIFVGICLWINLDVAPHAQEKMKNALVDIATKNPISLFGSDHVIDEFPGKKIYVEEKNGTELKNILVYELDDDANPVRVVFAKKGEIQTKDMEVLLHIYDARFEQRDPDNPKALDKIREGITMKESVFSISLKELIMKNQRARGLSQMGILELMGEKKNNEGQTPEQVKIKQMVINTELNKRYSFSLASFAFALIGVPLAITAHRKETSIGFLFSIIVGFSYFFFSELSKMVQNKPQFHPDLLVWLPNVIFISLGAFMFWRLSRK